MCSVLAPAPHPEPTSCLNSVTRDNTFLSSGNIVQHLDISQFLRRCPGVPTGETYVRILQILSIDHFLENTTFNRRKSRNPSLIQSKEFFKITLLFRDKNQEIGY